MSDYQAFLLRLQRNVDRSHWYATLENVHTGESLHFSSDRALLAYLAGVTASDFAETESVEESSPPSYKGFDHA